MNSRKCKTGNRKHFTVEYRVRERNTLLYDQDKSLSVLDISTGCTNVLRVNAEKNKVF